MLIRLLALAVLGTATAAPTPSQVVEGTVAMVDLASTEPVGDSESTQRQAEVRTHSRASGISPTAAEWLRVSRLSRVRRRRWSRWRRI